MTVNCNQPIGDPNTWNNAFVSKNSFASDADADQFISDNGIIKVVGERYYNTTDNKLRLWDGLQWIDISADFLDAALIGNPTAPTQPNSDDSTKIATTEFVKNVALLNFGSITYNPGYSVGVAETNSSGRPILLVLSVNSVSAVGVFGRELRVDGNITARFRTYSSVAIGQIGTLVSIVPAGSTWRVDAISGTIAENVRRGMLIEL